MKLIFKILCFTFPFLANGQTSYRIAKDTVVFEFDANDLDSLFDDPFCLVHDFDSLKLINGIKQGAKSLELDGEWCLTHIQKSIFQLRKTLDNFDDRVNPWDKYMILREYWKYPRSSVESHDTSDQPIFKISDQGVTFILRGNKDVSRVILTGNFNGWDEQELEMKKVDEGWKLTLDLIPGIYEYKFIADGKWTHDTENPLKLENEHHTFNSILLVGKQVIFSFKPDDRRPEKVYVSGSFNNWDEASLPMTRNGDEWKVGFQLPPGKHYYKFIVDGEWITDPENMLQEKDEQECINSVLIVNQ